MHEKQTQKRNSFKRLTSSVILTLVLVLILTGCSFNGDSSNAENTGNDRSESNANMEGAQEIAEGENLIIPVDEVSETARFYPIEVDGTIMEVLAVKAPDGTIRTAFNTCEVCYDSGRGYYEQSGDDVLVCQNCGNRFKTSQVEVQSRGCNPWPIFPEDKTVTDTSITISYDFLSASIKVFENWKRSY